MRNDEATIKLLFEDYVVYQGQTEFMWNLRENIGAKNTRPKETPDKLARLAEMLAWCRERDIEPRRWLFSLFSGRKWKYPVKLEKGHLCSEKMIAKYRNMSGLGFFRRRVAASAENKHEVDPNRDIIAVVEGRKQGYASTGQWARCRDEMMSSTFGYHPKSSTCVACPERHDCAIALAGRMPFDIIALRDGRITAEDAERIAHEGEGQQ